MFGLNHVMYNEHSKEWADKLLSKEQLQTLAETVELMEGNKEITLSSKCKAETKRAFKSLTRDMMSTYLMSYIK